MSIHRFTWDGISAYTLSRIAPSLTTPVSIDVGPTPVADVALVNDAFLPDLTEALKSLGWTFKETSPPNPPDYLTVKQEQFNNVQIDNQTTGTVFQPLLDVPITTEVGFIDIQMSASVNVQTSAPLPPANGVAFRVLLDGVVVARTGTSTNVIGTSGQSCVVRVPVLAGLHNVVLQWRVLAVGDTGSIRPVTQDTEHCSMLVKEIAA